MMINGSYQLSEMLRFFITVMDLTMENGALSTEFRIIMEFCWNPTSFLRSLWTLQLGPLILKSWGLQLSPSITNYLDDLGSPNLMETTPNMWLLGAASESEAKITSIYVILNHEMALI